MAPSTVIVLLWIHISSPTKTCAPISPIRPPKEINVNIILGLAIGIWLTIGTIRYFTNKRLRESYLRTYGGRDFPAVMIALHLLVGPLPIRAWAVGVNEK